MLEVKGPGGGTHLVVVGGGYPGGGAGLQQGQGAGQCPRQRHGGGGGAALSSGLVEFPARLSVRLARLLSLMTTRNEQDNLLQQQRHGPECGEILVPRSGSWALGGGSIGHS